MMTLQEAITNVALKQKASQRARKEFEEARKVLDEANISEHGAKEQLETVIRKSINEAA